MYVCVRVCVQERETERVRERCGSLRYFHQPDELSLCACVCVCVRMCVYVYGFVRESERERE